KKHPLGEKRNHPGSKLRQGFWMVFRLGVNNWGLEIDLTVLNDSSYSYFILLYFYENLKKSVKSWISLICINKIVYMVD
ncbi:hypothetical protein RQ404_06840, partial [Streptococcus pneumoniae]|nr:hypothetical protein [Streptococcus pneumoniae]MDS3177979.1 hypothetical protein [Streptococcus pneumoniae]MDS3477836.1 hypothetical protein [Streptococcus pneumoniae]MDS3565112.1 hypothetical protein [Streptococcus pneumoniae]MDS3620105.1 hypothetical protein [Streptococcus pneumoniae]